MDRASVIINNRRTGALNDFDVHALLGSLDSYDTATLFGNRVGIVIENDFVLFKNNRLLSLSLFIEEPFLCILGNEYLECIVCLNGNLDGSPVPSYMNRKIGDLYH